jgi:hypothetical protein
LQEMLPIIKHYQILIHQGIISIKFIMQTYSASHSWVAPENVGLQKEQKYNTFVCHTCNEVRLCVLGIRKKKDGNTTFLASLRHVPLVSSFSTKSWMQCFDSGFRPPNCSTNLLWQFLILLHVIPVMKCDCVFWEFAKRKLATRKDKIR